MKIPNRQILRPSLLPGTVGGNHPIIVRSFAPNHPIWHASVTLGGRRQPTDHRPISPPALLDHSARSWGMVGHRQAKHPNRQTVEELKVIEAEARETDKALQEILKKIGV